MEPTVDNVIAVYQRATLTEYLEGREWYPNAFEIARDMDPDNPSRAAGILAAFSPQCPWWRNIELAHNVYLKGFASGHTKIQCAKAEAIYTGADPAIVLGGVKTTNFYHNIVNPLGHNVTIDGHAFDIAIGETTGEYARKALKRKGVYEQFANVYRAAASVFNLPPAHMQAITWVRWRIENETKSHPKVVLK